MGRSRHRHVHKHLHGGLAAIGVLVASVVACNPTKPQRPTADLPGQVEQRAVFDPTAIGPGVAPPQVPAAPPGVRDYGPRVATRGSGEIHVRFDQPMVPLGVRDVEGLTLDLTPSVPGRLEWKTPKLLTFVPDSPLQDAHRYAVAVAGSIETPSGQTWSGPLKWTFTTQEP
ncbi:MAG: Ig-like domain-containing protein, partial [Nannocystaceae bacterium]